MKATIVSFALAIVLCGQAMAQEPSPPPAGPDQGPPSSMMNPPARVLRACPPARK